MKHTEYIIPIGEDAQDYDEMFIGVIRRQPELIRCKDCKYNSNTEGNYVNCGLIPQMFGKTPDDNYCSDAEPKETS